MFTAQMDEPDPELPWDFYLYVGLTILGLTKEMFFNLTPNGFLKLYIKHLEYTQPEALKKDTQIYTLDQTPFL